MERTLRLSILGLGEGQVPSPTHFIFFQWFSTRRLSMITLSNGDKWIIDESEVDGDSKGNMPKTCEEVCNLPETPIREFIEKLISDEYYVPRKLTSEFGGYWNCNFDSLKEILSDVAVKILQNDFSKVYEMPWMEVLVVYKCADSGGYDVTTKVARFANREEYMKAVTLI
jgi:hypothetical protein